VAILFNMLLIILLSGLKLIGYIFYWNLGVETFLPVFFARWNGMTVMTSIVSLIFVTLFFIH
jgi:hypothetical protein